MTRPLRYDSAELVRLGDVMSWGDEATGQVLVMIEDGIAMRGHDAAEWDFLERGFMLSVDGVGLIHYTEIPSGAELVRRLCGD